MRRTQSSRVPTYQGWIASKEGHGLEPTGLVRTANQIKLCACEELGHHVLAEREAHAAITLTPATNASDLRIRPQQVAQQIASGISVGRGILRSCSRLCNSGERPACTQRIFSSTIALKGRQSKTSLNNFHILTLYRILPEHHQGEFTCERRANRAPVPPRVLFNNSVQGRNKLARTPQAQNHSSARCRATNAHSS